VGRASGDARHQINLSANYTLKNAVAFSVFGRVQSGNPFTPSVSGDVNGDGYNNDRAYIFDPARTSDRARRASMSSLCRRRAELGAGAASNQQLGTIAGTNSLRGSRVDVHEPARIASCRRRPELPDRATISLGIANPLTGIDALVHGSNNLHGWGAPVRRSHAALSFAASTRRPTRTSTTSIRVSAPNRQASS
jgi:hypothetical protein